MEPFMIYWLPQNIEEKELELNCCRKPLNELSIVPANIESSSFWKKHGFQDYMHKLFKKIK
jgi:hypothetical protein